MPAMTNEIKKISNWIAKKINNTKNFVMASFPLLMGKASIFNIPLFFVSLLAIITHTTTIENGSK